MSLPEFRIPWSGRALNYSEDEIQTVVDVMRSADPLTQGKHMREFEAKFKEFAQVNHAFAVNNCANALNLAAILSKVGPGDEVIIPAHTYCATALPFARVGAKIVWADIDPNTLVVSAKTIQEKITPKTKMVVVVHLYGLMPEMDPILDLVKSKNLLLLEDCAQAIGAKYKGKPCGSFGDFSCFSFHGQKNITTLGEGGFLCVKDDVLAKAVPGLRHNGHKPFENQGDTYWIPAMVNLELPFGNQVPFNFTIGEVQCALGKKLLDRVGPIADAKAKRYQKFRSELSAFPEVVFQQIETQERSNYHLLPVRYDGQKYGKNRDDLIKNLAFKQKVKAIVQYYPLYRYPIFQKLGHSEHNCPNTDAFFDNMISIPFHEWMSDSDFDYLIQSTKNALTELRG